MYCSPGIKGTTVILVCFLMYMQLSFTKCGLVLFLAESSVGLFWLPVCLSACKLFFSRPLDQFQLNKASLGKGYSSFSNERPHPYPRGDNSKNTLTTFKIFFFRTTEPISTKLGRKHPWVKGIQVYSNERPHFFSRRDNNDFIPRYLYNRSFAQACVLLGNVSQVSDVTHEPLV